MKRQKTVTAIIVFYVVAVLLRYLAIKTSILSGVGNELITIPLQGIGPTIGALVACVFFKIKIEMNLTGNFKNLLIPLLIYWIFPILLIGLLARFTNGTLPFMQIFIILIYGLFEEIGWRGFLRQLLRPLPKFAGILVLTVLWYVWHLSFELGASNLLLFGILLLGSWGIGVVADKTNSFLAVAAFHSLNNFFQALDIQKIVILTTLFTVWVLSIVLLKKLESKKHLAK